MHKIYPYTCHLRSWFLVANQSYRNWLFLCPIFHHFPQDPLFLYAHTAPLLTDSQHQPIHALVLQSPIDIHLRHALTQPLLHRCHPLPIAEMRQHKNASACCIYKPVHFLHIPDIQPFPHLFIFHAVPVEGLRKRIAELMIKILLDLLAFGLCLVRERVAQVHRNDLPAVPHHVIHQRIHEIIRQCIMHAKGQTT